MQQNFDSSCHEETHKIKQFKMLTLETKYPLHWPNIYEPIHYTLLKGGQKSAGDSHEISSLIFLMVWKKYGSTVYMKFLLVMIFLNVKPYFFRKKTIIF